MATIYIIYVAISAILLFFLTKGNLKEWSLKVLIVGLVPIFGWFFPVIWPKKLIKNYGQEFSDYINKQDHDIKVELLDSRERVELEKELNVIPLEEALVVSDYSTRRKMMIDVLKEDVLQYIDVIKTAVVNEDTETSHYAVTAVLEVKRKLLISLQELSVKFEQDNKDLHTAQVYAEVIREYIRSGFIDMQTVRKYRYTYLQVLEQIILHHDASEHIFEEKIETEMLLQEYTKAEKTAQQYLKRYSNYEKPYLVLIKLYYETKSINKMLDTIQNLKQSTIKLSNQAKSIVNYWSGGLQNEVKGEVF